MASELKKNCLKVPFAELNVCVIIIITDMEGVSIKELLQRSNFLPTLERLGW